MLEYEQQDSFIFDRSGNENSTDVTSVNNSQVPEMNNVGNTFCEPQQDLYSAEQVPSNDDPRIMESFHQEDISLFNVQHEYSTSNTQSSEASSYKLVDGAFSTHFFDSTYQPTEYSLQDEYISCDFTQPLPSNVLPLTSANGYSGQNDKSTSVQVPQYSADEPLFTNNNQSNSSLIITEVYTLQNNAAVQKSPVEAPKKSTRKQSRKITPKRTTPGKPKKITEKKQRRTALKPAVVSEWQCVPCDRMFRAEIGLLQHNICYHSGKKPYSCSICGKRYQDKEIMQQHERRHTAVDKPFKCQHCTRQYYYAYDLKRHIDLHHGVARYNCRYCGKAFDRDDHVKSHETSHENGTVKRKRKS